MLAKRRTGGPRRKVKVSFTLTAPDAETVYLLGDFNDWQARDVMTRGDDGTWGLTLTLDPDREYQFRYLVNETDWYDEDSVGRCPNPFGGENGLLILH